MSAVAIEGQVTEISEWTAHGIKKGYIAKVKTVGGSTETVGFTAQLRVPKKNVQVRIEGNRGKFWIFAKKWEYLVAPKGKTPDGFPVKGDNEIEDKAFEIIRSLNEFTVDDLHTPEIMQLIEEKNRDSRVLGSILRKLKTRGLIKEIRIVHSKRETCHKRPVVLWTRTVNLDCYTTP